MEQYSSGRRGVTRNLVGQGTGARVQIPAAPPKNNHTIWCGSFLAREGFERPTPVRRLGVKSVRGTLFRPWENPWICGRSQFGCGRRSIYMLCIQMKMHKSALLRPKKTTPFGVVLFYAEVGVVYSKTLYRCGATKILQIKVKKCRHL